MAFDAVQPTEVIAQVRHRHHSLCHHQKEFLQCRRVPLTGEGSPLGRFGSGWMAPVLTVLMNDWSLSNDRGWSTRCWGATSMDTFFFFWQYRCVSERYMWRYFALPTTPPLYSSPTLLTLLTMAFSKADFCRREIRAMACTDLCKPKRRKQSCSTVAKCTRAPYKPTCLSG